MSLRKIMLTIMASAAVLGVGADIQSPIIHARHVRTYQVRRHRTFYKIKRVKRTKKNKKAKRNRKSRKSWRINRKRHGRYLTRKVSRTRRPIRVRRIQKTRRIVRRHSYRRVRGLNKYVYNVSGHKLLQDMAQDNGISIHNLLHRYSTNGKSIKAFDLDGALTPIAMAKSEAKDENESFNTFFNMSDPGTGKLNQYDIQGSYMTLTPTQLKHEAANSDTSISNLLSHDVYHPNKYVNGEGFLTKAGTKLAEQDAINDLNQIRENKGVNPLTEDSNLEFLAEKRAATMGNNLSHFAPNGDTYDDQIAAKYNIPSAGGENLKLYDSATFETPSQIGHDEQQNWDLGHQENRESPADYKVGIGINPNGGVAEEFE